MELYTYADHIHIIKRILEPFEILDIKKAFDMYKHLAKIIKIMIVLPLRYKFHRTQREAIMESILNTIG
jgi:hypothetical protein